jgi:dTDP-4-dehydrorhamnose 3,5-epimerase
VKITETRLPGVLIVEPRVFVDHRGSFAETWHMDRYREAGIPAQFEQDNVSFSRQGVLRGLHYQIPAAQGKLVTTLRGSVFDVAVDLRVGSSTFKQWVGVELSAENMRQLWIPEGFAHGFLVTAETALVSYKCTRSYVPGDDRAVRWNDPQIGIDWRVAAPFLSSKDAAAPLLAELSNEDLFDPVGG